MTAQRTDCADRPGSRLAWIVAVVSATGATVLPVKAQDAAPRCGPLSNAYGPYDSGSTRIESRSSALISTTSHLQ